MSRAEYNNKILTLLKEYLEKNPDIRFIQALWNIGIIDSDTIDGPGHEIIVPKDRFYEESSKTLKRIDIRL